MASRSRRSRPGRDGSRWEYCLLTCTRLSGLGEANQVRCSIIGPGAEAETSAMRVIRTGDSSPQTAIVQVLNELGQSGWELVSYDLTTNRGLFKRRTAEPGGRNDP